MIYCYCSSTPRRRDASNMPREVHYALATRANLLFVSRAFSRPRHRRNNIYIPNDNVEFDSWLLKTLRRRVTTVFTRVVCNSNAGFATRFAFTELRKTLWVLKMCPRPPCARCSGRFRQARESLTITKFRGPESRTASRSWRVPGHHLPTTWKLFRFSLPVE